MNLLSKIALISMVGSSLLIARSEPLQKEEDWSVHGNMDSVGLYLSNEDGNESSDEVVGRVELGLRTKGKVGEGELGFEIRGRATNDERVSLREEELLLFRSLYNSKNIDIQLGDVAQTYNMLVYTGTIKGATVDIKQKFSKDSGMNYSLIGGVQTGSWHDFGAKEFTQKNAVAAEIKYTHDRAQFIALSAAYAKERLSEMQEELTPDLLAGEATTVGLNFDWRFNRYIKAKGNIAYTSTLDTELDETKGEYAGKLFVYTKPTKTTRSDFKYERYSAGYDTLVTRVAKNRERISNVTSWRITNSVRSRFTLKSSRDNLDGKNENGTSKVYDGSASITYRPEFLKRGDIDLRVQDTIREGRGDDSTLLTYGVMIKNSHKFGLRYGLGYEFSELDNTENKDRSNTQHTVRGNIGYKNRINEDNMFRTNLKINYTQVDNIGEDIEDQTRIGGTVDMGWEYAKKFMFDMLYTSKVIDRELSLDNNYDIYQLTTQYRVFADNSHVIKLSLKRRESDGGTQEKLRIEDEAKLSYAIEF